MKYERYELSLQSHVHGVAVNGSGDAKAAVDTHNLTGGKFCGCKAHFSLASGKGNFSVSPGAKIGDTARKHAVHNEWA